MTLRRQPWHEHPAPAFKRAKGAFHEPRSRTAGDLARTPATNRSCEIPMHAPWARLPTSNAGLWTRRVEH